MAYLDDSTVLGAIAGVAVFALGMTIIRRKRPQLYLVAPPPPKQAPRLEKIGRNVYVMPMANA